jgi:hypothetical protein
MRKIYMSLIVFFVTITCVYAQENKAGSMTKDKKDPGSPSGNGIITGKIVGAASNRPIEYANIVLHNIEDSTIVTGTISDVKGNFNIERVPHGYFYLTADFIGYHKTFKSSINLNEKDNKIDLGILSLEQSVLLLEEVKVTAEKPRVEYKIDKKIINIDKNIVADGGSALDALENIPSIYVDIDGNISVRGSTSFSVLIDGRLSPLSGTDALKQIPVATIRHIELITNPSARYDPDGVAGILNIVTKKNILRGVSGFINTSAGSKKKYYASSDLGYRAKKFNLFLGTMINDYNHYHTGISLQKFISENTTSSYDYEIDSHRIRNGWQVKLGIDYDVTRNGTLTLQSTIGNYASSLSNTTQTIFFTEPETEQLFSRADTDGPRNYDYFRFSTNYQHNFTKENKIEIYFNYSDHSSLNSQLRNEYYTGSNFSTHIAPLSKIQTEDNGAGETYRFNLDYTGSIREKVKLEAGYQTRINDQFEDYHFAFLDTINNNWITDDNYSSVVDFYREIHSIYASISGKNYLVDYKIGLRGEYVNRCIKNPSEIYKYRIKRFDIFPTIHVSKQVKKTIQFMANYGRRIWRPKSWNLTPFVRYFSATSLRIGNPELQPMYTDSYELSCQKILGKSTVTLETFYRKTKNRIQMIASVLDNNTVMNTIENLEDNHSLGVELSFNLVLFKWFTFYNAGGYYRYWITGEIIESGNKTVTDIYYGNSSVTIKMGNNMRLQFDARYRTPSITAQGQTFPAFNFNVAVRKDFLNGKLSTTLRVRNLFGTAREGHETDLIDYYAYMKYYSEPHVVNLSLTYKFNNYKSKKDKDGALEINGGGGFY